VSSPHFVGQPFKRKEDRRLFSGRGKYVADIRLPRMAHVAFARSSVAHARIKAIDISRAQSLPGVIAVYTAGDLANHLTALPGLQQRPPAAWRKRVEHSIGIPDQPLIADTKVRHVGEPYAVVVAENRYIAEDAAELIQLDFELLPVLVDPFVAVEKNAPKVHDELPNNVVARFRVRKGDRHFESMGNLRSIKRRLFNHRFLALPIECRGVVAEYDERNDFVTIWSATQIVHWVRREVAKQLNLPEARIRCIAPDVGGGFGVKGHVYPEDILIPFLARHLGRPVAWIEDRLENLLNSSHSRDDAHDVEMIFDDSGRIVAIIDEFVKDSGAYTPSGIGSLLNTVSHISGPYEVPNLDMTGTVVLTNKTPNTPYRGSGRPEGAFVIERLLDLAANELSIDPIEIRFRNLIPPEKMPYDVGLPYRDGVPIKYDSGDYPRSLRAALQALGGLEAFRAEQKQAWRDGRYLGLGVVCYVEGTGVGPFEGATVRVDPSGSIMVATGACSAGQGHETIFAQVAADEWKKTPQDITVVVSDSAAIAYGFGSIASRSTVNSSGAIRKASAILRTKVLVIGAHLLECDVQDVELSDSGVALKGAAQHCVSLKDIAKAAQPGWDSGRPPGMPGGLEVTEYFEPETVTWSYGTHAAILEVVGDTGEVRIRKYVVAHDAGVLVNPMLANGQIMGGVCQGIGGCLLERVVYDAQGQNTSGSLADYLIPVAAQMPELEILHTESPSPLNELGVKGLGEGGVVGPPGVIVNGVCDALRPLNFDIDRSYIDQAAIVEAIARARA
jgi:aerobic carbon-monoxide dehydrogenase large subunit